MASKIQALSLIFICQLIFLIIPSSIAQFPRGFYLPVTKDQSTRQYLTTLPQRTPLVPLDFTVDLGGQFFWVDCDQDYVSSSYTPAICGSSFCSRANSSACGSCSGDPRPGCNSNTCSHFPYNPISSTGTMGELASDLVSLQETNGSNRGAVVSVQLPFVCGSTSLLQGLANGVRGMVGLGRAPIAFPSQLATAFTYPRKFVICLGRNDDGVIYFGGNRPYGSFPGDALLRLLSFTPLLINPVSTAGASFEGEPSSEYFIGVRSIEIRGRALPINATLLSINEQGRGGTKISTVNPYTVMERSIYNAVAREFDAALGVPRVRAVRPFKRCYNASRIGATRTGPDVPIIDLVLQSTTSPWRIYGINSMVSVSNSVMCLGFVDGGRDVTTSIVIGGHQIEDNFLQFELGPSRLGFTSSLWNQRTTCNSFRLPSNSRTNLDSSF